MAAIYISYKLLDVLNPYTFHSSDSVVGKMPCVEILYLLLSLEMGVWNACSCRPFHAYYAYREQHTIELNRNRHMENIALEATQLDDVKDQFQTISNVYIFSQEIIG